MMTIAYAREQLKIWLDAQTAVAGGQAYTIGRRSLTRVNLADILKMIQYWQGIIADMEVGRSPGRVRVMRGVPRDL